MPVVSDMLTVVVLAAGGGLRLGGGKLLLPWRGKPILAHTLAAALRVRSARAALVVVGHDAAATGAAVERARTPDMPPVHVVDNPRWRDGMASSLQCAVAAIMERPDTRDTAGAMIVLGDQPLVRPETLNLLAGRHLENAALSSRRLATVPFFRGARGNPVVLSRELYPALLRLEGDVGARHILAALGDGVLAVPVDDPAVLLDVDTPDDFEKLQEEP